MAYRPEGDNPNHGRLSKLATYRRPMAVGVREFPGKGRGLVAMQDIPKGSLIETAPMLVIPQRERPAVDASIVFTYLFVWEKDQPQQELYAGNGRAAIVLGLGSLLNHSDQPNAGYEADFDQLEISFTALRDIASQEEITIDYELDLWFQPV